MTLMKCPRCDLNYITPDQKYCKVCLREMNKSNSDETETEEDGVDANSIGDMDDVTDMDEIIPDEEENIPGQEYGEIEHELSLEEVREDEEREADDEEEEET